MDSYRCSLRSVRQDAGGAILLQLDLPLAALPRPGQYLLVDGDPADSVLPRTLFRAGRYAQGGLQLLGSPPRGWMPGYPLGVRGPLGRGFTLPSGVTRLALVAAGETAARLLPLLGLCPQADFALFGDAPLSELPAAVEAYPLSEFPAALSWAEFVALDLPRETLLDWRTQLGLTPEMDIPSPAQALVATPMPCGGLADCGVCALPARRGYKLACKHGPVFDWGDLAPHGM